MNFDLWLEIVNYRRKTCVVIAALLAVNLVLYGIYAFKQKPALENARKLWTEQRKTPAADDPRMRAAVFAKYNADLAAFRGRIPQQGELPVVLGDIFKIVSDNGLKAVSVTYNPQFLKEQRLWAYAVKMTLEGNYFRLKHLVDDLQQADGMVVLDTLRFTSLAGDEDVLALDLSFTFYLQESAQ